MDDFEIQDGSNDKAYFTMVPNIVLNHSSAVDQALYMQMKRFAGEKSGGGYCSASKRTLMGKLGIGLKALNESIDYLVSHGWISPAGVRKVMTSGGSQDIKLYRVNDIWKLNTEFYKGDAESTPLSKGVAESAQGVLKSTQGVAESATTKNNSKKVEASELEDEIREIDSDFDGRTASVGNKYTKKYIELCDWMASLTGVKFVDRRGQFKALKLAREGDISAARLKERAEDLWASGRFEQDGMDWFNVVYSFNKKS